MLPGKNMNLTCWEFAILVGLTVVLTGCGGGSSSAPPEPQTLSALVDSLANSAMKQQRIPGMTVALAKNGTILYSQAYGDSDMAMHTASKTSTIFEIGSITKQFTAALVMQLQEQGELHVDDSIQAYLPEYKFPSALTLRMLLTDTSGLANYTTFAQYPGWATNGVSEAKVLSAVSQTPRCSRRVRSGPTPIVTISFLGRSSRSSLVNRTQRVSSSTSSNRWV
jgi:CubicO group peptidase (beta-lactamase class C family)